MLTSVAYRPGRVPATQQPQFVSVCLPHTIFTLYAKPPPVAAAIWPNFSRRGCVWWSALEWVCFVAIATSAKGCGVGRVWRALQPQVYEPAHIATTKRECDRRILIASIQRQSAGTEA